MRREYNKREAKALLLAHSNEGHFTEASLRRFLWSGPVRTAQKNCVKVGSTLKATAKQLQHTGVFLTVGPPFSYPTEARTVFWLLRSHLPPHWASGRQADTR